MTWAEGDWTEPPASVTVDGDDLVVVAVKGSDAWRETAHGYVTDNAHALLVPMQTETSP